MRRALAIVVWIIALVTVALFFVPGWWLPRPGISDALAVDRQFLLSMFVIGVVFLVVQTLLGLAIFRFGVGSRSAQVRYSEGNNRLEAFWTVGTAVVLVTLALMGQRAWAQISLSPAPAGAFRVELFAQQFQWTFHYAGPDKLLGHTSAEFYDDPNLNFIGLDPADPAAKDDLTSAVLLLPLNKPVDLLMHSKDVIHSFWVPNFRLKQDVVPGLNINTHFTPTRAGKFELACAELCGQFHYKMKASVVVLPQEDLDQLLKLSQPQFQKQVQDLLNKIPVITD